MSNRNQLLATIVEKVGGTVRNPRNRNMLLEDWLAAVSAINYQYTFDGIDDYITVPSIVLEIGDTIEFTANAPSVATSTWIAHPVGTTNNGIVLDAGTGGNFRFYSYSSTGAIGVITTSTFALTTGQQYNFRMHRTEDRRILVYVDDVLRIDAPTSTSSPSIGVIGCRNRVERFVDGVIKNIVVKNSVGTVIRSYPINDGWAANPVIADTVGGQNGTAFNFQEPSWGN